MTQFSIDDLQHPGGVFKLERPLMFFDCETTGPEPKEDRICSLSFLYFRPDGTQMGWHKLINPTVPIPHEATYGNPDAGYDGHGITDAMVADQPTFKDMAPSLLKGFTDCDFGGTNIYGFDLKIVKCEFERAGITWDYDKARVVDSHRLWKFIEPRTLTDAVARFLHEKMEGAHDAVHDIRASFRVVLAQMQECERIPRDLQALHDLMYPKRKDALDPQGQIVWRDGSAVMNFGKNWRGKRLDLMSRRDLEWIVGPKCAGANSTTKQICADALLGIFPKKEETTSGSIAPPQPDSDRPRDGAW